MPMQMDTDEGIVTIDVDEDFLLKTESSDLCRICANTDNQLIPIFSGEGLEHSISTKIDKYLPIKVTEADKLPLHICFQCASALIAWHNLYEGCIIADKKFREILSIDDKVYQFDIAYEDVNEYQDEFEDQSQTTCEESTVTPKVDGASLRSVEISKNSTSTVIEVDGTLASQMEFETERYCREGLDRGIEVAGQNTEQHASTNEREVASLNELADQIDGGNLIKEERVDDGESKDKSLPEEYQRFVVQYHKTGIRYMQCDKCQFICRPLVNIFEKHYRSHFNGADEELEEKPDITVLEEITGKGSSVGVFVNEPKKPEPKVLRPKVIACTICDLTFRTRFDLKTHKKTHANRQIPLICSTCGKSFKTKAGYSHHRANVCVQYKCEICEDLFLVKSVLQDHLKKVHDIEEDIGAVAEAPKKEQATTVCPVCGKMVTENALSRHMNLHSEDKPYICDLCGKQFRIKWSLREHIMVEIGMKDYVCEICGKKFVIQAYLNKHMRFHMMCDGKFEGYQCEICGKKYAEEWKVKEHQRSAHRDNDRLRYKCDMCDKRYTRKWLVRSHKRIAHKENVEEYECNVCNKKFTEKWIIKLHLQTVHNVSSNDDGTGTTCGVKATSDEVKKLLMYQKITRDSAPVVKSEPSTVVQRKPFECELCGKVFATKQGMKNHLYAELNLRKYVCEICGKRYNWWMGLKEHYIMNHGEKEFVCAFCGKDFPTKKRCRDHLSVHSNDRPYTCKCGNNFKLKRYLVKHQKRCGKTVKKE